MSFSAHWESEGPRHHAPSWLPIAKLRRHMTSTTVAPTNGLIVLSCQR